MVEVNRALNFMKWANPPNEFETRDAAINAKLWFDFEAYSSQRDFEDAKRNEDPNDEKNFGSVLLDERESFVYLPRELFVNESYMRPQLYSQQIVRATEFDKSSNKTKKVEKIVYREEDLNTGLEATTGGFDFAWNETDVGMGFSSKTIGAGRNFKALEYAQKRDLGLFRSFNL
jgi:hypothetical protein